MKREFVSIFQNRNVEENKVDLLFQKLHQHYSDPNRHYHNITHIREMLEGLEEIQTDIVDKDSVKLAIWFHDCFYSTRAQNNEEESADIAAVELQKIGIPDERIKFCCEMILSTKSHVPYPNVSDCNYLLDLDLMILGKEEKRYNEYKDQVRREYSWVSDEIFRDGRALVLKKFLARERIYYTDRMYNLFEEKARSNIERELTGLIK